MNLLVSNKVVDGVAHVRLDRRDKLNALTLDTLDQLISTARDLQADRSLRAVVLAGAGDSFCAGLDFAHVLKTPTRVTKALTPNPLRGTNAFQEACWAWRRVPVPVIAAVHGHCFGGGVQLALAADFRFTTPDAQWSVMEARWGLIPDMSGVQALSELVGIETAKRLTMSAAVIDGNEAARLGLVGTVDADPIAAATAFAAELATRSPDQLAAAKRLFSETWHRSPRRTFSRERFEQVRLLASANTAAARQAAFKKVSATFGERSRFSRIGW